MENELTNDREFTFNGLSYNEGNHLYYIKARYYDSSISSFISRDTYPGDTFSPSSFNHYAYCAKDPVNHCDRDGHQMVMKKDEGGGRRVNTPKPSGGNSSGTSSSSSGKNTPSSGGTSSSEDSFGGSDSEPEPERVNPKKNYVSLFSKIKALGTSLSEKAKSLVSGKTTVKKTIVIQTGPNTSVTSTAGKEPSAASQAFSDKVAGKLASIITSATEGMETIKATAKKAAGWVDDHLSDIATVATKVGTVSLAISKVISVTPLMATPIGAGIAAVAGAVGVAAYGVQALAGGAALTTAISGKSLDGEESLSTEERLSRALNGTVNVVSGTLGAVSSFKACRSGIDEFYKAIHKSATKGTINDIGKYAEKYVSQKTRLNKNTTKYTINGRKRIPDFINNAKKQIIEVKNVLKQSLTQQIRDEIDLANQLKYNYVLWVRKGTQLSDSLNDLVKNGTIILKRFKW